MARICAHVFQGGRLKTVDSTILLSLLECSVSYKKECNAEAPVEAGHIDSALRFNEPAELDLAWFAWQYGLKNRAPLTRNQ